MPLKLLIVDLDPGIRYRISDPGGFIHDAQDQALRPGILGILEDYDRKGWKTFAITNAGSIAAGHISFEEGEAIQGAFLELAPTIEGVLFCPDMGRGETCYWKSRDGECAAVHETERFAGWSFRQPGAGMIDVLTTLYQPDEVLCIGSRDEDMKAAKNAIYPKGCQYKTIAEWVEDWETSLGLHDQLLNF